MDAKSESSPLLSWVQLVLGGRRRAWAGFGRFLVLGARTSVAHFLATIVIVGVSFEMIAS